MCHERAFVTAYLYKLQLRMGDTSVQLYVVISGPHQQSLCDIASCLGIPPETICQENPSLWKHFDSRAGVPAGTPIVLPFVPSTAESLVSTFDVYLPPNANAQPAIRALVAHHTSILIELNNGVPIRAIGVVTWTRPSPVTSPELTLQKECTFDEALRSEAYTLDVEAFCKMRPSLIALRNIPKKDGGGKRPDPFTLHSIFYANGKHPRLARGASTHPTTGKTTGNTCSFGSLRIPAGTVLPLRVPPIEPPLVELVGFGNLGESARATGETIVFNDVTYDLYCQDVNPSTYLMVCDPPKIAGMHTRRACAVTTEVRPEETIRVMCTTLATERHRIFVYAASRIPGRRCTNGRSVAPVPVAGRRSAARHSRRSPSPTTMLSTLNINLRDALALVEENNGGRGQASDPDDVDTWLESLGPLPFSPPLSPPSSPTHASNAPSSPNSE